MHHRFAWGVPIAIAVVVAGCGGSSGPSLSAFKHGFGAVRPGHTQFGAELGAAIQTAPNHTNSELATEFQRLSTKAAREAAQLRRLDPPSKYRSQLDQITSGFGTVGAD